MAYDKSNESMEAKVAFAKYVTFLRIIEVAVSFLIVLAVVWGTARYLKNKRKKRPPNE